MKCALQRHAAIRSAHLHLAREAERSTSSRLTLRENTSPTEESEPAPTRRAVDRSFSVGAGGESPRTTERAPTSPTQSTNKQQAGTSAGRGQRSQAGGLGDERNVFIRKRLFITR
ncbi:Hypothetical predicted protein [Xyrichtys novacula]|uniref:Uncharacterized protein n=1 Tax=Xyrichtys novacula TaxID=13765 RepID=A0AAV1FDG6_XYRNO|nr:Hypothetical predicted protein [Xyrichtys novacula]